MPKIYDPYLYRLIVLLIADFTYQLHRVFILIFSLGNIRAVIIIARITNAPIIPELTKIFPSLDLELRKNDEKLLGFPDVKLLVDRFHFSELSMYSAVLETQI